MIWPDTHIDERIYCYRNRPGYRILFRDFRALGEVVPAGFEWNGADSPWFTRLLIPKYHRALMATCYHDYGCVMAESAAERKKYDEGFYYILRQREGMWRWRAWLGYAGVRLAAKWKYRK